MTRIRIYRDKMLKYHGKVCPRIAEKLKESEKASQKFAATWNGGDAYEVSTAYSCYVVNLKDRTCTCRRFQLTGIPCYHAASAILRIQDKLEDYVDECYHTSTYLKTYTNILAPLNGKEMWPVSTNNPLSPPVIMVQPGRRKKARNKKNDEPKSKFKLGKHRAQMHCANCGKAGHNIRKCSMNQSGASSSAQPNSRKRNAPETQVENAEVTICCIHNLL